MQLRQPGIGGGVPLAGGRDAKIVTGIDDCSRFLVVTAVILVQSGRAVTEAFAAAMRRPASPSRSSAASSFTARCIRLQPVEVLFERVCRENGIPQRDTKPRSPAATGKIKPFHKSLRAELLDHVALFKSLEAAQTKVNITGWSDGLEVTGGGTGGGPLPVTVSRMGCLVDVLEHAYRVLGFADAAGGDRVFRELVLAWIMELSSKLDSLRVLGRTVTGSPDGPRRCGSSPAASGTTPARNCPCSSTRTDTGTSCGSPSSPQAPGDGAASAPTSMPPTGSMPGWRTASGPGKIPGSAGSPHPASRSTMAFAKFGDSRAGYALHSLGRCYLYLGRGDEALDTLWQAVETHRASGNRLQEALNLKTLAGMQEHLGLSAEAVAARAQAADIFDQLGDHEQAAELRTAHRDPS